jgi:hypothetical protein
MRTTTAPEVHEVDAAVRAVLADLLGQRGNGRGPSGIPAPTRGEELFPGRLLAARNAEALPAGTRVVRVSPGTVVTPLAREVLKKRAVEVRFASRSEADRARGVGEWGFAVEPGAESGMIVAFRRSMLDDAAAAWRELGGSVEEAAGWVSEGPGRGALVLAEEASVAVFRGCRVEGVRAASAEEPGAVARAVRALGVNLLVVEPSGKSIPLLRQMAATFRLGGGPVAPDWLTAAGGAWS